MSYLDDQPLLADEEGEEELWSDGFVDLHDEFAKITWLVNDCIGTKIHSFEFFFFLDDSA